MKEELAFVLINPYTIGKSRTGGVIGRFISSTGLKLAAARMFGPSRELVEKYAELVHEDEVADGRTESILSDYVRRAYMPDEQTGLRRRVMMLLFQGEDAVEKIRRAAGKVHYNMDSGRTVRDIYGDYIVSPDGKVMYVEPAVLIGPTQESVEKGLKLWAEYSEKDGGIIADAADLAEGEEVQQTLVLIKPDNFRFPSARPGKIIDIFSGSGLRIVGAKVHCMSVAAAEEFYGPVRNVLRSKLKQVVAEKAAAALSEELEMPLPESLKDQLGDMLGPLYGDHQFYEIIRFMTGEWAPDVKDEQKSKPGREQCLALVYAGPNAVDIIRGILGPTDPSKAEPGSVRREFGQDIMVNAAHASDSEASAERELGIVRVEEDMIKPLVEQSYS